MARYGQRPENALKRANEFIEVGKPARALDTLQEVFRNKKWAYNWSESVLEPIMFKYLDLCVELKKSHIAKEGLFQYRNMFQSVNVGSLENVIRGYLRMAEEKTENAREQSAQAVIDIDDLDNLATPESLLLSAVSGEDAQDRSDRTILTPWVKFLWESYCQCLELLRTNAHVETLYHDIARMAFQFCLKYNRKTEFRKLCDKLRKHLEDICKLPQQAVNVSISKPETQQLNLETRLYQLDSAIQMELWQEAYKAIEDIHGLMSMSKKFPVPKTMANYYQKLAMVFWKAGNYLFHAAALFKLFQLSKEMKKNITIEELQRMACRVLIATLSIPLPSAHPEFDRFIETDKSPLEKAQRLAVLLGLSQPPTRASLLRDLVRINVVSLATPQLQELYSWLEQDFDPLTLCPRVSTVIDLLQAGEEPSYRELQQYIPALQDVTLVRLVRQVAQVYQTIEIARLLELAGFTTAFHLERLLVDCVRHNDMQIRIDHARQCVHFGRDLSEAQREDRPEGPTLQSMPSEQIRNQLVSMASVLHRAVAVINPNKRRLERERLRAQMVHHYHENKVKEHQRILQRHKIIEDRKEYIERLNIVREEEEMRRQEEVARQQLLAEHRRLEQEREERERKRQANEMQQIRDRHLKEKMQQISQTSHGQKVLKKLDEDEIKKMDAEQIAAREAEELQKERRELQAKLKSQEKKIDYFERAKRLEEIPLIQKAVEEKMKADKEFWEQQEAERIALAIEERKLAVANRERLARMKPDREAFLAKLKSERNSLYEDKLREFEKILAEERTKRLQERAEQRKRDRRTKWFKEKVEEEERKREAERLREEEELKLKEEKEKLQREEEERLAREAKEKKQREQIEMAERAAAKQRIKEEEIEAKLQKEREESMRSKEKDSSWRKGGAEESGSRATSANTETADSWRGRRAEQPAATAAAAVVEGEKKPSVWRPRFREQQESGGKDWRTERRDEPSDREDRRKDEPRARTAGSERDEERREEGRESRDSRREDSRREDSRREDGRRMGGERDERDRRFERSYRSNDDRDRNFGDRDRTFGRDDRDRGAWRKGPDASDDAPRSRGTLSRGGERDRRDGERDRRGGDRDGERDRRGGERDGDRDWRKDDRARDDRGPMRRGGDDTRTDDRTRKTDEMRRGGSERDRDDRRGPAPMSRERLPERVREQPSSGGNAQDGDDGTWTSVGRRR